MGCASSTQVTASKSSSNNNNNKTLQDNDLDQKSTTISYPIYGDKSIMKRKAHGTSETPVQSNLRWSCNFKEADRICNYNRHFAERAGSFAMNDIYKKDFNTYKRNNETLKFYDSNTGKLLFQAGGNKNEYRSHDAFWKESISHGWPSFRDDEVNWEFVRCLKNGECVSIDGTHLGHNLPDKSGNRYCINLVSIAGRPEELKE